MKHLGPLALFAALAVAWTWPLALHLGDAIPGGPGDNYSFVWNLWWMRHVLATPGLAYFHTSYLFYPFGTTIADHPHTALPALVAATLLKPVSVVTAQNLLLLGYLFANMACAYALTWSVLSTKISTDADGRAGAWRSIRRASVLGALVFGLSPYLASHLLGHFDLIAAWCLPLFALLVRRAMATGSNAATIAAGLVLTATAYTAYYYVVYLGFFLAVYLIAWIDWRPFRWTRHASSTSMRRTQFVVGLMIALLAAIAVWIVITGGRSLVLGGVAVSVRTPQNVLTGIWSCAVVSALCVWRPERTGAPLPVARLRRASIVGVWIAGVFAVGAAPLLWQAAQLIARHQYVSPNYQWRSAPRGVDLLAPLLGPPLHPLLHVTGSLYNAMHLDRVESVGWMGIVPLVLLAVTIVASDRIGEEVRIWRMVGAAFAIWALGPILTIGGFDTGLKLPAILLRYVPFVANARMPGRAMVGVFLALAVLAPAACVNARGAWRRPALQWLLVALVAFEYWDAPIPLTALDRPAVYAALAAAPPGAVCEVPFGIGDGLSVGVGSQERVSLYYATIHEHELVGGYIGRMPADAELRYDQTPIAGTLLRLSGGRAPLPAAAGETPCHYLVVTRAAMSPALTAYVSRLPLEKIAADRERDLYRVNSRP